MKSLSIEDVHIEVIRKDIKNINLSVHPPNGRVRLSAPKTMSDEALRLFVISKLSWIKKQREKFKNQPREIPIEFISGESHYLFGEKYLLNVLETKYKQRVEIDNNYLKLYVRKNSTKEKRESIMNEWYRGELKLQIPKYIEKWEPIMNVSVDEWNVRKMKARWGSCHIRDKKIIINLELAKKNLRGLEYIVVHEMVHLLERNHNDKFKEYMDEFLPNWREIKNEINGIV